MHSGPIQVEQRLTTAVAPLPENWILRSTLTLKVANETISNSIYGTNYQLSNSRNSHEYLSTKFLSNNFSKLVQQSTSLYLTNTFRALNCYNWYL